ncbi:PREDICTED: anthocyanidin reductase isoform X1 [Camelina sativa]|uniref:Anthocyanidin reductase isoform X1 n=1 Tax=Camelina sativa TaxID=90675 RepID=A0ABM0SYX1_CAMSA|nr:PREDICTED: anthocyanidin reductase isoform X1 [Camelina sativa]
MAQTLTSAGTKKVCVIGGTGNFASILIKHLLLSGYKVNTTVRDPENEKKMAHLRLLQELGDLKIFKADLTDEGIFDSSFSGCEYIFHVATPINFKSEDPEKDMIKPAIQGVINVLKSCVKAKSIKRVIYTSSAAAVSINNLSGPGLVMNEKNWTDIDFLTKEKPFNWGYPVSKMLAEKTAWEFAEENNIDLVTVIPALIAGNTLLSDPPSSLSLSMSLITGKEMHLTALKEMQKLSGSISFIHVDDVARAHLFLAEKETASGRYICCAYNTSVPETAGFLRQRYPKYNVLSEFEECLSIPKLMLSSEKIINEGFRFEYGINEMYDQMIEYFESKGLIKAEDS